MKNKHPKFGYGTLSTLLIIPIIFSAALMYIFHVLGFFNDSIEDIGRSFIFTYSFVMVFFLVEWAASNKILHEDEDFAAAYLSIKNKQNKNNRQLSREISLTLSGNMKRPRIAKYRVKIAIISSISALLISGALLLIIFGAYVHIVSLLFIEAIIHFIIIILEILKSFVYKVKARKI